MRGSFETEESFVRRKKDNISELPVGDDTVYLVYFLCVLYSYDDFLKILFSASYIVSVANYMQVFLPLGSKYVISTCCWSSFISRSKEFASICPSHDVRILNIDLQITWH